MRISAAILGLLLAMSFIGSAAQQPAKAADPYCPDPTHVVPGKVPADLVAAVAKAFRIDADEVNSGGFVRCAGATLMGCYVGANLVCDKADTRLVLPGATTWCRKNPGSPNIPMSATGHATIYDWSCKGQNAVAGKIIAPVDPDGYLAANWKPIP
jgi:hypothetical protein